MSLSLVQEFAEPLPLALREQVTGYARSVAAAAPAIFHDAGIAYDEGLANRLAFVAGLRKLHSICSIQYWSVDNSLRLLQRQVSTSIKMGSTFISRDSEHYLELRHLLNELEEYLAENDLLNLVRLPTYAEVLEVLAHG